jgi:deazaflavin-dependent oxidoreductase (nitroreductase family)
MPTTMPIRASAKFHKALYRFTKGRVGRTLRGATIVFLTTTGRRTGAQHTWPLVGIRDGDDWVVMASNGGNDVHPSWYLNLTANPGAMIEVGGARSAVRADVAKDAERARIWSKVIAEQPVFAGYQKKTDREIPVVVLKPSP